jgi:hypothetical protein
MSEVMINPIRTTKNWKDIYETIVFEALNVDKNDLRDATQIIQSETFLETIDRFSVHSAGRSDMSKFRSAPDLERQSWESG